MFSEEFIDFKRKQINTKIVKINKNFNYKIVIHLKKQTTCEFIHQFDKIKNEND